MSRRRTRPRSKRASRAGQEPAPQEPKSRRTPDDLLNLAFDWIRKTGWPTRTRDKAIAADIYEKWIKATNRAWASTQCRDYELMAEMIREAFAELHDEEAVDSLQILLTLDLTLRARLEGKLARRLVH